MADTNDQGTLYTAGSGEKPDHGFGSLIAEAHPTPTGASREEVEEAFRNYVAVSAEAGRTGNWDAWSELFVDDAIYVEHHFGIFRGRTAIRTWIKSVMTGPARHMDFPVTHYVIDGDVLYTYILNRFLPPDGSQPFQFPVVTILCYAGEGSFCYEEDVYNPLEGNRMMAASQAVTR